jgi:hypothetical protein
MVASSNPAEPQSTFQRVSCVPENNMGVGEVSIWQLEGSMACRDNTRSPRAGTFHRTENCPGCVSVNWRLAGRTSCAAAGKHQHQSTSSKQATYCPKKWNNLILAFRLLRQWGSLVSTLSGIPPSSCTDHEVAVRNDLWPHVELVDTHSRFTASPPSSSVGSRPSTRSRTKTT